MQRKTSKHNDHCDHNDLVYWQLLHFWPTQWSLWDKTHTMILVWVLWSQDGSCDHILSSQVITASLGILSSQVIASCDHKMGIVITMILVWVLWLCLDVSWHLVVSWSVMTACVIMTHQHVSSWHISSIGTCHISRLNIHNDYCVGQTRYVIMVEKQEREWDERGKLRERKTPWPPTSCLLAIGTFLMWIYQLIAILLEHISLGNDRISLGNNHISLGTHFSWNIFLL